MYKTSFHDVTTKSYEAVFSLTGTWIAFVTPDKLVWRPDSVLLGHLIGDDVFTAAGDYLGTIQGGLFSRLEDRAVIKRARFETQFDVPGYPGLPAPSLIRPVQPGETLEAKLVVG